MKIMIAGSTYWSYISLICASCLHFTACEVGTAGEDILLPGYPLNDYGNKRTLQEVSVLFFVLLAINAKPLYSWRA